MRLGEVFAGYGGLGMGVELALGPMERAWVSEFDPAPSRVLAHHWPGVPNLGDITKIDWSQVESVDVLTGGFPCQDVSLAGARAGMTGDTRSGMWSFMRDAIAHLRPRLVVIENVRGLLSAHAERSIDVDVESCEWCVGDAGSDDLRALGAVLGDLAGLGFDAEWGVLAASAVGAPHRRERVFIVAWPAANAGGGESELRGAVGFLAGASGAAEGAGAERQRVRDAVGCRGSDALMLTPTAHEATGPGLSPSRAGGPNLRTVVSLLPTPVAVGRDRTDEEIARRRVTRAGSGLNLDEVRPVEFGHYAPAVAQWEAAIGRPAPNPTEAGTRGGRRLAAPFVEWMMGLPDGHVTGVGLTRTEELKALGNGVVPQQAAAAVRALLGRAAA